MLVQTYVCGTKGTEGFKVRHECDTINSHQLSYNYKGIGTLAVSTLLEESVRFDSKAQNTDILFDGLIFFIVERVELR